jgi:hypothetical protein
MRNARSLSKANRRRSSSRAGRWSCPSRARVPEGAGSLVSTSACLFGELLHASPTTPDGASQLTFPGFSTLSSFTLNCRSMISTGAMFRRFPELLLSIRTYLWPLVFPKAGFFHSCRTYLWPGRSSSRARARPRQHAAPAVPKPSAVKSSVLFLPHPPASSSDSSACLNGSCLAPHGSSRPGPRGCRPGWPCTSCSRRAERGSSGCPPQPPPVRLQWCLYSHPQKEQPPLPKSTTNSSNEGSVSANAALHVELDFLLVESIMPPPGAANAEEVEALKKHLDGLEKFIRLNGRPHIRRRLLGENDPDPVQFRLAPKRSTACRTGFPP